VKIVERKEVRREPADGLLLAVLLPNQQRKVRKFNANWKWQIVIDWAASIQSYGDERVIVLRQPTGEVLDPVRTLEEQSIIARTVFNVLVK
jgi:hypothetical protein